MITDISIKNFKSIAFATLEIRRLNVFVGTNGSGKTNLLEAIGMLSAERRGKVVSQDLVQKGIRVVHPDLTYGSFYRKQPLSVIEGSISGDIDGKLFQKIYKLQPDDPEEIRTDWTNEYRNHPLMNMGYFIRNTALLADAIKDVSPLEMQGPGKRSEIFGQLSVQGTHALASEKEQPNYIDLSQRYISDYLLYSPCFCALTAKTEASQTLPLGIHGERINLFLRDLSVVQAGILKEYMLLLMPWLKELEWTPDVCFCDRLMLKKNNRLSIGEIDSAPLLVMFYLSLFVTDKTPPFFAIDRFADGLAPSLCSHLLDTLVDLARQTHKQVLLTTSNPGILDELDLEDDLIRVYQILRTESGISEVIRVYYTPQELAEKPLSMRIGS